MYIQLMRRQRSVQRAVKQLWLPCWLDHVRLPDGRLNEAMLLQMIPAGWLPDRPENILVSIAHSRGSTGLKSLTRFRPWGRHFDCYILELWHDEPHA